MPHPSLDIVGEANNYLGGKCVLVGVTSSVAAYKAIDLARWLMRRGAKVRVLMTPKASRLISPTLFHWATASKPITRLTGDVEHIALARECHGMVIAPATLATMAKIASGIGDNPVTLTAISMLGYGKPVTVAPAMHANLARSRSYVKIINELMDLGVVVIPPLFEGGVAKMADISLIGRVTAAVVSRERDLAGKRVLVTAGPTREWIDKVRFVSNPSSGIMGVEVAIEAWARGAVVDLVHGPLKTIKPHMVNTYEVETTEEMADRIRVLTSETEYDALVAAAAPVDFKPEARYEGKIRSGSTIELKLVPTPKTLESIVIRPRVLVAFAAEVVSGLNLKKLIEVSREKIEKYGADILVSNIVGVEEVGFSSDKSAAVILEKGGKVIELGVVHKEELARTIMDLVASKLAG